MFHVWGYAITYVFFPSKIHQKWHQQKARLSNRQHISDWYFNRQSEFQWYLFCTLEGRLVFYVYSNEAEFKKNLLNLFISLSNILVISCRLIADMSVLTCISLVKRNFRLTILQKLGGILHILIFSLNFVKNDYF